jgi:antitoxin (DNA-binding transcriptional repressor) of toxin-antitoxin stability system
MIVTNIEEAQENLPNLLQKACFGEEIIIRWQGQEIKLAPVNNSRTLGRKRGQYHVWIADDFDVLPNDVLEAFTDPKE